uniref:Secreted protein n=1 Tax=Panagrellus redivivus TaxID=6233 RepID=A0A7E4ZYH0_PANRE
MPPLALAPQGYSIVVVALALCGTTTMFGRTDEASSQPAPTNRLPRTNQPEGLCSLFLPRSLSGMGRAYSRRQPSHSVSPVGTTDSRETWASPPLLPASPSPPSTTTRSSSACGQQHTFLAPLSSSLAHSLRVFQFFSALSPSVLSFLTSLWSSKPGALGPRCPLAFKNVVTVEPTNQCRL